MEKNNRGSGFGVEKDCGGFDTDTDSDADGELRKKRNRKYGTKTGKK